MFRHGGVIVHWFWEEPWIRPWVAVFIVYLFIYWAYQIFIAIRGVWSPPPLLPAKSYRHFAILIPAHNEEKVIGNLLESLIDQNYPSNCFDIYVSCDNCQDRTAEIAKSFKVNLLEKPETAQVGKTGNVQWALREIPWEEYDAVAMFDADNLAEKNFLAKMNDYLESHPEAQAIQGYLDTKNPNDTWISRSYALSYWYTNRFWQLARSNWGLSAALGGTGLVVTVNCLKTMGWDLKSLTEDLEFSTRIILSGGRVHWNNEAIIFDEKPLTFWASRR
ncbi:MAG: glycosyltransferase, partial [Candidatus Atribacteria bacterium]|nr:glycosyltransferase [Candidatus Atribacteria bacterium]